MTKKDIKNLEEEKARLEEAISKYCPTQGAVSEKQRWYFIQCLEPLKREYKACVKQLKSMVKNYNKHDK